MRRRAATANQGATGSRPTSARARSLGRDLDERRVADLGAAAHKLHGTPAAAHAATTALRRSAGTSGIVTRTSSGRAKCDERLRLVEGAEHLHAEDAASTNTRGCRPGSRRRGCRPSRAARERAVFPSDPPRRAARGCATAGAGRDQVGSHSQYEPRCGDERCAQEHVDGEDRQRESRREDASSPRSESRSEWKSDSARDRNQVARRREAPDTAVDPEHDEEDIADAEEHRQGREEDRALQRRRPCRR